MKHIACQRLADAEYSDRLLSRIRRIETNSLDFFRGKLGNTDRLLSRIRRIETLHSRKITKMVAS